jgi:tetratricopeptide (TPR) repeat protein
VWVAFLAPRFQDAGRALLEGTALLNRHDYREATRALTRGTALIEGIPGGERLSRELAALLRLADRVEEADRLHRLVDRLRFAESAAMRPDASARELERNCRTLWEARRELFDRPGTALDVKLEPRLRDDLLDLAVIGSNLRVGLETDPKKAGDARREALKILDQAEALLGPGHVVYRARQVHAKALGLTALADDAARRAREVPPRTAWELDAVGRILLAAGELAQAQAAFEQALDIEPQDLWPNFHQGVCAYRLGHYQDAVAAFRVCVALAPDRAECFYNRALAHAGLSHTHEASRDYARAFALDPSLQVTTRDRGDSPFPQGLPPHWTH